MDTQKEVVMAISQLTEELAKSKFVVGAKQLKKALKNGNARRVFFRSKRSRTDTKAVGQGRGKVLEIPGFCGIIVRLCAL